MLMYNPHQFCGKSAAIFTALLPWVHQQCSEEVLNRVTIDLMMLSDGMPGVRDHCGEHEVEHPR